ncbi:MAG: efflux RND transporter permease subunit [Hyphomicrobiales bacterium]
MVKFLINRPIAVLMTVLAFIALGIISGFKLPVGLLPDIEIPEINVQVSHKDFSARQLEESVVKDLRYNLQQVNNVTDIESTTRNGFSIIKIRFKHNTKINLAFIEVNEKVDKLMTSLPKDFTRPRVIKTRATDIPAFYLSIVPNESYWMRADDFLQLSDLSQNIIKRRLEQLNSVGMVDMSGLDKTEIMILPNSEKLRSLGISQEDISRVLINNNTVNGNIIVKDGHYQYSLNLGKKLSNVEDISNLLLRTKDGKIIPLNELAQIKKRVSNPTGRYLYNDQQAVSMTVIKQADARMERLSTELHEAIDGLHKEYPDFSVKISRDQTSLLKYSIDNLLQSLIIGTVLSLLIMFLFIGNFREPLIMTITIPCSLIISILFFHLIGISINIVSLSGLVLGVGMMIDNSIIVIDNINQHLNRGLSLNRSCVKGTNEVIRPLLSSALTTCSVFIPLIFLSDITGAMFFDQAMAVTMGLMTSFLVSVMVLPIVYRLFYLSRVVKKRKYMIVEKIGMRKLEQFYLNSFDFLFKYRKTSVISFFLLIPISVVMYFYLGKTPMPALEQNDLIIQVDWSDAIPLQENEKRSKELITTIQSSAASEVINAFIGKQQFILGKTKNQGIAESQFYIKLKNSSDVSKIKQIVSNFFNSNYHNTSYKFSKPETIFEQVFSKDQASLEMKFFALDANHPLNPKRVDSIQHKLNKQALIDNSSKYSLSQVMQLKIKSELLLLYNVSLDRLRNKLKTLFNSNVVFKLNNGINFFPVILGNKSENLLSQLNKTMIMNNDRQSIPLSSLIDINSESDFKVIYGSEKGEYVKFIVPESNDTELALSNISNVKKMFTDLRINLDGSYIEGKKLINNLIYVLLISTLLLYFILAAQFESLVQPAIILTEILFDFAGCFLMLILFGSTLNLMSAIGIIVVTGIIINDSILKVDTINQLRKEGYGLLDAIHEGGKRRLRPILMTSLTTILALVPLLLSGGLGADLQKPLALAVIGGMTLGTIVSIYFIPLAYYYLYRKQK